MANVIKEQSSGTRPKVLVVDDEPKNVKLLEAQLLPQGYDVMAAFDGEGALKKVAETKVDLILLDVMMPGIDGFEVTRRIRKNQSTRLVPIVLITALKETKYRTEGIEAGCDDFLTKPFDASELKARVRSLLKLKAYHDHMQSYERELETAVARKTKELRQALSSVKCASLETIYRLSRAAEYKDEHTGSHILRMSHYAAALARRMGLNERDIEGIRSAAPMHDVGKIGVPDHILLKPGKLTPDEWEKMKEHTTIGARILEGSETEFIKLAEIIALTHHEKWDGSGYPKGLAGAGIPVYGRICAITDVFDATTTDRPYRKALSNEKALEILKEGRGKHFDPKLLDIFLDSLDEVFGIQEKYARGQGAKFGELFQGE